MICDSVYLLVFIRNLLVHLAEKILLLQPLTFGGDYHLVLTGLDRLEEPPSLVALRQAVSDRLPQVDLPELLLEIDARTGFADAFTHASEADARAGELRTSVCAVLVSRCH